MINEFHSKLKNCKIYDEINGMIENLYFDSLSKHCKQYYSRQNLQLLKYLEKITEQDFDDAKYLIAKPFNVENGIVKIEDDSIFAKVYAEDFDSIKQFSIGGLLAPQWFGQFDSYSSTPFSVNAKFAPIKTLIEQYELLKKQPNNSENLEKLKLLINYLKNEQVPTPTIPTPPYEKHIPAQIIVYFDSKNPVMQNLLNREYISYQHEKITHKDMSKYSSSFQELADNVLNYMECYFKDNPLEQNYYNLEILGGIPANLISGIAINSKNDLTKIIEKVQKLFPNIPIFDEFGKVFKSNQILKDTQNNILEK